MKNNKNLAFSTRAIHSGYCPSSSEGALNPPVYMTSTFCFDSAEQGAGRFAGKTTGHFYSRISNPTQSLLESRLADLEGAEAGLATASGMGAITALCWSFLSAGDKLIADKTLYGCTFAFFQHGLKKFGVEVEFVDCADLHAVSEALTSNTRAIYFETPVNPNMRVLDISGISSVVHDYDSSIRVVVDNTYCTPAIQQPLLLGADLVVHSATKYLGGHGDLIAGAVLGSASDISKVRLEGLKDMTGAVISPMTAFLVLRGLKTLELRMKRHSESAQIIAERLQKESEVEVVYYPGLADSPFYNLASSQMSLPGGMIAFELKGGYEAALSFINSLSLIKRAVSLGDAETLCQHPASMTHSAYTLKERQAHGVSEGLIRISVGLESVEDIYADIASALG